MFGAGEEVGLVRRQRRLGVPGLTRANVAVLKNGRAKAVRFSTLEAICRTLNCQPGDLLQWIPDEQHEQEAVALNKK
ncbi:helix-turn-helix domain-containing protein [Kribbella sp. NBC_01484]|nr:helix-turn-helix domain-containing protein [Kribbella sp. NBC_01484]